MNNCMINIKVLAEKCKKELPLENSNKTTLGFYKSLPICILDAVFSIGIKYAIVVNVEKNYMEYYQLKIERQEPIKNEHTINDFIFNIEQFNEIEKFTNEVLKNKNRTSSNNGILKADACYQIAKIMQKRNINTLNDFKNYTDKQGLNKEILQVKGQGSGIMLKYLYMLTGDESLVKPDRWIERYIQEVFPEVKNQQDIQETMQKTVNYLKPEYPNLTVGKLDGMIWKYQTTKKRN